jgi:radical SAM superfamily enzyme YgiQ (UPF0313 family)
MATRLKMALIQPSRYLPNGQLARSKGFLFPSLTFPLLAALAPDDVEIVIRDDRFGEVDFAEKVDLVGITSYTTNVIRAYEIADEFRRRKVPVLMGGMHISMEPEEAADHADTVIVGEAEETWPQFIEDFKNGKAKPRYIAEEYPALEHLPVPRFSLLNPAHYVAWRRRSISRFLPVPILPIQTARGCPHNCEFCSVTAFSGRQYRVRPVADVVNEIRALGLKACFFVDDNIFADRRRAKELFQALIPLRIRWASQGTIGAARNPELLRLARESGCMMMFIGLESIVPRHLREVGKYQNQVEDYGQLLKGYRDADISVTAAMVFGFDAQPASCFDETCDFLIGHGVRYTSWYPLMPYPGTLYLEKLRSQGRLKDPKWWLNRFLSNNFWVLKFTRLPMGEEAFWKGFFRAYKRFYSPVSILKRVLMSRGRRRLLAALLNFWVAGRVPGHTGLFEA